ncbi:ABC transporter substrate-binding protein [Nocardia halotolerans]|uniref:ABC transporter substrate-binding protein n=1 Tax=Nocardia halotolerans TaxID=1755878 RepID=A0ABV8VJK8_9NOCA
MLSKSLRSRVRTGLFTALVTVVTLSTATACGTDQSSGPSGSSDGTLSVAIQGTPNSFDPAQLLEGQQAYVWAGIFDTLLYLDNDGKLQPNAAESWQISDDAKTVTLRLRSGMTFSSGAPVNAAAVKATMDRTKSTAGTMQNWLRSVNAIRTPDDHTVVLELARPDAGLLPSLAMGPGVIGDPATMSEARTALNPVGSGPYTLNTAETVNGTSYVLNRRDDHWNVEAYPFRTVKIRVIPDRTATLNALQAGELNAGSVEATHLDRMKASGFEITPVEGGSLVSLVIADRKGERTPALADPRVRKAINMAFDRTKIVEQITHGAGTPTVQTFNPMGPAYDPALANEYRFDVEGAKRLLAEAGYPDGFAVNLPETVYAKTFAPTVTQSLAAIGIAATWEPVPMQQANAAIASQRFPMTLAVDGTGPFPRELQGFAPDHARNPFHTAEPELTALIDQYNRELDPERADELAEKINAFTVRYAWDAPMFFVTTNWVTKDGVKIVSTGPRVLNSVRQFDIAK